MSKLLTTVMSLACLGLLILTVGCSQDKDQDKSQEKKKIKPPKVKPVDAVPKVAATPRDPRIVELFAAGKDCTWNDTGFTSCEAATKMNKLAFEEQSNDKLAASCLGALRDPEPSTRGLAAVCINGFNDVARIPHLAAGLDAFEAEKEPTIRVAIACAFSSGNARESGVEERVIALVRKLAAEPQDDRPAACLLNSMFPQYLMQATKPPSKAAGDVALELLTKGESLKARAIEAVGLLSDRKPEVCAALAKIAVSGDSWAPPLDTMAKLGDACLADLDPVIDVVVQAMNENKYNTWQYQATRTLIRKVPLTKQQVKKLKRASQKLVKLAKGVFKKSAKEINVSLTKYKPPVVD